MKNIYGWEMIEDFNDRWKMWVIEMRDFFKEKKSFFGSIRRNINGGVD